MCPSVIADISYESNNPILGIAYVFQRPDVSIWTDGIDALAYALGIERELNQHLLTLRNIAATAGDSHVRAYLFLFYFKL